MLSQTTFQFGARAARFQSGELARQATGAVRLDIGSACVLATVVAAPPPRPGLDFLPLTVDYIEKTYAAGFIPRGVLRREGMPSEREALTSRLIDRSLRPLFPKWFRNDVHVVVHVLSLDAQVEPDIMALLASAAAVRVANLPFDGPVAALRMACVEDVLMVNPDRDLQKRSSLDLVVAATPRGLVMLEGEAKDMPEVAALSAIDLARQHMAAIWQAMDSHASRADRPVWNVQEFGLPLDACDSDVEKQMLREQLVLGGLRTDGRSITDVRELEMRTGVLPRTHGSALFTRGQTQSLAVVTLGGAEETQTVDALTGRFRERFLLHYNMPPFAVGEAGRMTPPKRREMGHGRLARRALMAVLPEPESFPYTIRVVSEILESNGSSSMATVCAACLAMLDAGVPLTGMVAGIAIGASTTGGSTLVLTDITEEEDHLGDMDFKVAGTFHGFTALQMDVKAAGVTLGLVETALAQAKDARRTILAAMAAQREHGSAQVSPQAPGLEKFSIPVERIGLVIGRGGVVIRQLCEETACRIDVDDSGLVTVTSPQSSRAQEARRRIEGIVRELQIGDVCEAMIAEVLDFYGAAMVLPGGKRGLLHVSRLPAGSSPGWPQALVPGETLRVKLAAMDLSGQFQLEALELPAEAADAPHAEAQL